MPDRLWLADESATNAIAADMSAALKAGAKIWLSGEMGAGKSSFARGLLRALGYSQAIPSPTYTLIEHYDVAGWLIVHLDLYRLGDAQELAFLGLGDLADETIYLIEWAEKAHELLPPPDLELLFSYHADGRQLQIIAGTPLGESLKTDCLNAQVRQ